MSARDRGGLPRETVHRAPLSMLVWLALVLVAAPTARADGDSVERVEGLFQLALGLEHGDGAPRDPSSAAALYCQAARDGHVRAQYNLGWMYANGRGVQRDDGIAKFFFKLAAASGDETSARMSQRISTPAAESPACMRPPELASAQPSPRQETLPVVRAKPNAHESIEAATPQTPEFVPAEKQWVVTLVRRQAPRFGIAPELALAVIAVESNFDPMARSPKNAMGLMQLIPDTATRFRVLNPWDPLDSVRGGMAYLRWLLAYYQGNVELALAAYNAGEGAVDRFAGIPPFLETRDYVRRILALYPKRTHPYDPAVTGPSIMMRANAMQRGRAP